MRSGLGHAGLWYILGPHVLSRRRDFGADGIHQMALQRCVDSRGTRANERGQHACTFEIPHREYAILGAMALPRITCIRSVGTRRHLHWTLPVPLCTSQ